MTTIDDVRARLRVDLDDLVAAEYRWTDQELDRHINHALNELGQAIPRELRTTLQTTSGSRVLSVADLAPRIGIARVEYPTGNYPATYASFSLWGDILTLLLNSAPASAQDVNVFWRTAHVLDQSGSSLDGPLVDVLLDGAAAYAADQLASYSTERISTGGPTADKDYAAYATRKMRAFRATLRRLGPKASLRITRLYTPAEPAPSQDTDPGP